MSPTTSKSVMLALCLGLLLGIAYSQNLPQDVKDVAVDQDLQYLNRLVQYSGIV